MSKLVQIYPTSTMFLFLQFLTKMTHFSPPDWNPQKQSLGQILDKFGVRGVLECCKGKEGSQTLRLYPNPLYTCVLGAIQESDVDLIILMLKI